MTVFSALLNHTSICGKSVDKTKVFFHPVRLHLVVGGEAE